MPAKQLPKEKLDWFRLNARVAKEHAECGYCHKVMTKGRDGLGNGQCDQCLIQLHDELEAKRNPKPAPAKDARYYELLAASQIR